MISVDGTSGAVYLGEVPVIASNVVQYFEGELEPDADALVAAVHTLMTHADGARRLGVRANADNGPDCARARRFGAGGVGLVRTEHMFLGERRQLVEDLILAGTDDAARRAALDALEPLQRGDFGEILEAMDGLPVTIRLIDPPLHEFLPDFTDLSVKVALEGDNASEQDLRLLEAVRRLHEQNPMLGLRGVRLGLVIPGLFDMQVRAIAHATADRLAAGGDPSPEIMIPLVATVQELEITRESAEQVLAEVAEETGRRGARAHRHDDRGAAGRRHGGGDREVGRLLLLRHQRPDPDDLGVLPGRRGGRVLLPVHRQGHLRRVPVRDPRRRGRRPPGEDRRRRGPGRPSPA